MAISTFIERPRRGDGTIYGVPYTFRYESYEYELIDGTRFEEHKFDDMVDYVKRNHKSFSGMMDAKLGSRRMTPDDLNARRLFIVTENKKRQLKWDKEFNHKVVNLVHKAIEQGMVSLKVATIQPFELRTVDDKVSTMVTPNYDSFDIWYDRSLVSESEAYARCREQAENAIRKSMPPPDLLPMV
jgi:hypothetical protein